MIERIRIFSLLADGEIFHGHIKIQKQNMYQINFQTFLPLDLTSVTIYVLSLLLLYKI